MATLAYIISVLNRLIEFSTSNVPRYAYTQYPVSIHMKKSWLDLILEKNWLNMLTFIINHQLRTAKDNRNEYLVTRFPILFHKANLISLPQLLVEGGRASFVNKMPIPDTVGRYLNVNGKKIIVAFADIDSKIRKCENTKK